MTPAEMDEHVRRLLEDAPPIPADAAALLHRLGCPTRKRTRKEQAA